jgi:hypothetical protein
MVWHGRGALLAAAVVVSLVGCSGGEGTGAPLTVEPSVTIESTSSTTEPTTTTTEPTTTTTSVEDAVREAHTKVMTELFAYDSRVDGYEPFLAEARELTTGALLQRIEEDSVAKEAANEFFAGSGYESNIASVEINEDHATVLDCSRDTGEIYDAEGVLLVSAASDFAYRRTSLVMVDGEWLVEELYSPSEETCDPQDYQ